MLQLFPKENLVGIATRQAIRIVDHQDVDQPIAGSVPESIQRGPVEVIATEVGYWIVKQTGFSSRPAPGRSVTGASSSWPRRVAQNAVQTRKKRARRTLSASILKS